MKNSVEMLCKKAYRMDPPVFVEINLFTPDVDANVEECVTSYLNTLFKALSDYWRSKAVYPEAVCVFKEHVFDEGKDIAVSLFIDADIINIDTVINRNGTFAQLLHDTWMQIERRGDTFVLRFSNGEKPGPNPYAHLLNDPDDVDDNGWVIRYFEKVIESGNFHTWQYENAMLHRAIKRNQR